MDVLNSQNFEMSEDVLNYDRTKSILIRRAAATGRTVWAKKLAEIHGIASVLEDADHFYVAAEEGEINGRYLALNKTDGSTEWFIPGRALFQVIFGNSLYLIFIDEKELYYLLRIDQADGRKIWHYQIDPDLCEYSFRRERISLKYLSGKEEKISPATGLRM